jgi:hypothetical protein
MAGEERPGTFRFREACLGRMLEAGQAGQAG